MRLYELAAVAGFKPLFQKHDAASVDIMRWVWVATRESLLPRFDGSTFGNVFLAKISSVPKIVRLYMHDGQQPELRPSVLCSPRSPISRRNAHTNAVNSTNLAWSRLVRGQEDGGSDPLAPTVPIRVQQLIAYEKVNERLAL